MTKIAIFTQHPQLQKKAEALARQLHLPKTDTPKDYDYLLIQEPEHLALQKVGDKTKPLVIDFKTGKLGYRSQNTSLRRETLARAMGLKNGTTPYIVDTTAGLGRDSFILASLGFEITLLERSPIVHALLEDGLRRAQQDPELAPIIKRMNLFQTSAVDWLKTHTNPKPDIIYLDPMFPERSKSALVKKDMRLFHDIVSKDTDADELLEMALSCATRRVVVKRPRLAPPLAELTSNFNLTGSSSRFDIYLIP